MMYTSGGWCAKGVMHVRVVCVEGRAIGVGEGGGCIEG